MTRTSFEKGQRVPSPHLNAPRPSHLVHLGHVNWLRGPTVFNVRMKVGLFSLLSISSGMISTMGGAPLSLAYARNQLWPTTVLPQPFISYEFRFEVCKRYVMILSKGC